MRYRSNIQLACGSDPWTEGLVHNDGSIDAAGLYVHAQHCPDCSIYLQAFTVRMSEHDPEPPGLRKKVEQEYFSQREIATRLGVTPRTVKRWSDRGAFPGYPLWNGRRKLYKWTDIEAFLQQNQAFWQHNEAGNDR